MERTSLSLSSHEGSSGSWRMTLPYRVIRMSMAESEPPGWPDPASCIILTIHLLAILEEFSSSVSDLSMSSVQSFLSRGNGTISDGIRGTP